MNLNFLKLDPVSGDPKAPTGVSQDDINSLWSAALWGVAVIAAFVALGCIVQMWSSYRQGGGTNEGMSKLGWVLGGCIGVGMIAGLIGTITGT